MTRMPGLPSFKPIRDAGGKEHRRGGPLALCAETKQTEMAEALLTRGATLTAPVAIWLGKADWPRAQHAAGKLENPLNSEGGLLTLAVKHRRREIVELLLNPGFDPDERHRVRAGGREYHWGAPLRAWKQIAKLLLERGADPTES
jgi:ankyrin repeat protein